MDNNLLQYFVRIDACLPALIKMTEFISFPSLPNPQICHLIFQSNCPLFILWIQRMGRVEQGRVALSSAWAFEGEWEGWAGGLS